jgi:hypothetical protein
VTELGRPELEPGTGIVRYDMGEEDFPVSDLRAAVRSIVESLLPDGAASTSFVAELTDLAMVLAYQYTDWGPRLRQAWADVAGEWTRAQNSVGVLSKPRRVIPAAEWLRALHERFAQEPGYTIAFASQEAYARWAAEHPDLVSKQSATYDEPAQVLAAWRAAGNDGLPPGWIRAREYFQQRSV